MDSLIDGKYRVDRVIGEGGMGKVFAATHVQISRQCAIKVLKAEAASNPQVSERFMREARAAGRLTSEHVCRVTDVGTLPSSGEPFMVMELLAGCDLATDLRNRMPSVSLAATYISQACIGLAEAHAHGMIHRDIKPANLFLTTSNGAPFVKILDFGIATAPFDDRDHSLTHTHMIMGSPSYMSPEQVRSAKDVDARSDIWSLGVCLYELASGRLPFASPSLGGLAVVIATQPHAPLTDVPPGFAAIVDRCLHKARADRYATVGELTAALAPFCGDGSDARPAAEPGPADDSLRFATSSPAARGVVPVSEVRDAPPDLGLRPRRVGLYATGAIVVVVLVCAVVFLVSHDDTPPKKPPTIAEAATEKLREYMAAKNPFVDAADLSVMQHQVLAEEYDHYYQQLVDLGNGSNAQAAQIGSNAAAHPTDAARGTTAKQAERFCTALQARLPTITEWFRLVAPNAWGVALAGEMGPLREWVTLPRKPDRMSICGGYRDMPAKKESDYRGNDKCTEVSPDDQELLPVVGFRCVRDR